MTSPLDPNPDFKIINEEIEGKLKDIGHFIGDTLPKEWGFMLNLFSFGLNGSTFYISNAQRDDMIKHLREMADKLEAGE